MSNQESRLILAIESAIAGGSLALLSGTDVIAAHAGDTGVSRAEDLLPNIEHLLSDAGFALKDIGRIAVSLGPGSFTGLRIGIATVMGLKAGLKVESIGVSLLDALSELATPTARWAIAVPVGKNDVCLQYHGENEALTIAKNELIETVSAVSPEELIIHSSLSEMFEVPLFRIVDAGENMAVHVGRYALGREASPALVPYYIQNPRFA